MSFALFQHICPLVVAVIRRNDTILVQIKNDDDKNEGYYCPPGGNISFGESYTQALDRQFRSTYGMRLRNIRLLNWVENISSSSHKQNHEIIAVCEAEFSDGDFYRQDIIYGMQDDLPCFCIWEKVSAFSHQQSLYPTALTALLQS